MRDTLLRKYHESVDEPSEVGIRIKSTDVRLHFCNHVLRDYFMPSMQHLYTPGVNGDLDVYCFIHPDQPQEIFRSAGLPVSPHRTYRTAGFRYCFQEDGVMLIDDRMQEAFFWGQLMDAFVPYRAKPFSRLLFWYFEKREMLWLHAACIGTPTEGLIIPGIAGGGKSTLSAMALLGGLNILGDDYLLADPADTTVSGMYATLMLSGKSIKMLKDVPGSEKLKPAFTGNKGKYCHYLHPAFKGQLSGSLKLHAILVPQIVNRATSKLVEVSNGEVMNAFVSSVQTSWLFGGDYAGALRGIYQLVKGITAVKLEIGSDLRQVPALLEEVLHCDLPVGNPGAV